MASQFGGIAFDVCKNMGSFQAGMPAWQANTFLALLVTTLMVAIIYMFSYFYKNPQMTAWAKFELFQVLITALLAVGAIAYVTMMCNIKPDFLPLDAQTAARYNGQTIYSAAENYLDWLRTTTVVAFGASFAVNSVLARAQGITWNMRPTGVGFSAQPFAGLTPMSASVNILINGITLTFMITVVQKAILQYISIAMLNYLWPLGIFFRAFAPTRQFGGAMIGLAIGLFVFYPVLLVFNDFAIRSSMDQVRIETADKIIGNYNTGFPTNSAEAETARSGQTGNIPGQVSPNQQGNMETAKNTSNLVFGVFRIGFNLFIASVVLMALNFMVLITIVKEFSKIFGEEIDVSSLTRMI